ncbi:hypothetical protein [Frigoribacterium sp. PhB116]|nr:hypothetical protein [Frigoribacterium sp. PhB116]TDT65918.1 hypothetical protein EDF20_0717 [Frigoribacterium sp. PhB116]
MSVVTAASLVAAHTSTVTRVDPAAVDLPRTLAVDITAWLDAAAAQSPAA